MKELYTFVELYKIIIEETQGCVMENGRILQQLISEIVEIYGDLLVSVYCMDLLPEVHRQMSLI